MTDPNAPQEGAQPYQQQPYQPPQYQPQQPPAPGNPYGPPAGDPYGQPPAAAPYGQPPAGDPYGAPPAGGYGVPPGGVPPYQVGTPPKKRGRLGLIIGIVVVVLIAVCGIAAYAISKSGGTATNANEGDCLAGDAITGTTAQTAAALKVVKCDSTDAKYKVIAKIPDKKESEAVNALCQPYVDKGADVIYWQEKSVGAGVGNVLCLGPAKS